MSTSLGGMDRERVLALASRLGPPLVATLAVIGIAWQAAQLTWMGISRTTVPMTTTQRSLDTPRTAAGATINPQGIADAHLFGIAGATNSTPTDPNNLPQNKSLVLAGTMATDDPERGFAIVGETAANAKFYRVGASINSGIKLHSVYADRVVIDRNGTLETLILPRDAPSTAVVPTVRATNQVAANLQRLATASPETLGNLIRAQPVFANGVQKGYRVYPGRDRRQFIRLGLQPGDLIMAINGSTLDDPARGAEILNTLTSSTSAVVTVERNGQAQQISLDLETLSIPDDSETSADTTNSGSGADANNPDDAQGPARGALTGGFGPPNGNRPRSGRSRNGTPGNSDQ